jgi:hypothetical protein
MRAWVPVAFLGGLWVIAACDTGDLGRSYAEAAVSDHLAAVAPSVLGPHRSTVLVNEILAPNEYQRSAILSLVVRRTTPMGDERADTTSATAHFTRSDSGWSLSSYDMALAEVVSHALADEMALQFDALITVLRSAERLIRNWEGRAYEEAEAVGLSTRRGAELMSVSFGGFTAEQVRRVLADSLSVDDSIEWGVSGGRRERPIAWARFAADPAVTCAQVIGGDSDARLPVEFMFWVDREYPFYPTCQSTEGVYNAGSSPIEFLQAILAGGGIFRK